ncbi:MAG: radical SAM protein [Candidatus Paceibacterota bacterium]
MKIAWIGKHFGEEPPLVGSEKQGAGAIFFSGCNLRCVFCQNYQISQNGLGEEFNPEKLSKEMLRLEKDGAVNIDLVSPTIWWREIREAIGMAKKSGLRIPIIWNSNGFELVDILRSMEGLVDIYLPDFKYSDDGLAYRYSGVKKYVETTKSAVEEMRRQVGNLRIENGLAQKGLIVRYLILPGHLDNSFKVLEILSAMDKNVHISLMNQFYPTHLAKNFPEINRGVRAGEYEKIRDFMLNLGLVNGWGQEIGENSNFLPDFSQKNPFLPQKG